MDLEDKGFNFMVSVWQAGNGPGEYVSVDVPENIGTLKLVNLNIKKTKA